MVTYSPSISGPSVPRPAALPGRLPPPFGLLIVQPDDRLQACRSAKRPVLHDERGRRNVGQVQLDAITKRFAERAEHPPYARVAVVATRHGAERRRLRGPWSGPAASGLRAAKR